MMQHSIKEGATATFTRVTNPTDAYPHTSAELDFLVSTPSIVSSVISKSSAFLDPLIPSEYITVGKSIEITHLEPTLIGEEITIKLKVVKVIQNIIVLEFEGADKKGVFCTGSHTRAIVNKRELLKKAYERVDYVEI